MGETTPEQKARYAAKARERRAADPEKYRKMNWDRTPEQKAAYAEKKREQRAADPKKFRARDAERRLNPERLAQRQASDERNRDKIRERSREYYRENIDDYRAMIRRWQVAHPERVAAHNAVRYAIETGRLTRPDTCERCGVECKPDGAHLDYEKKLEVLWLCRTCHMRMDRGRG